MGFRAQGSGTPWNVVGALLGDAAAPPLAGALVEVLEQLVEGGYNSQVQVQQPHAGPHDRRHHLPQWRQ